MPPLRAAALLCAACHLAACSGAPAAPGMLTATAHEALREGELDRAARDAKLALQDDPLDADAHLVLAATLARQGELDQAVVGFRRAFTIDPSRADAAYGAGTLLLRREEAVAAARWLEAAVASRPEHVPSYVNLGKAYAMAGLPELAVAAWQEALRRDPHNDVARANLTRLHAAAGAAAGDEAAAATTPARAGPAAPAMVAADAPAAHATRAGPSGAAPSGAADDIAVLREQLADLPHVQVELRGGRAALTGWTRDAAERALLERVLIGHPGVLDLTTDDVGDPQRMVEVDATIFVVIATDADSRGFDFLRLVTFTFDFFSTDHDRAGTGFAAPATIGAVGDSSQSGWLLSASVDYDVTIANATDERVAILARPHLTTLSGAPAAFLAGGEFVFRVAGNISGDIRPYPFGTSLQVTPTLLRTPAEDGTPRVHLKVEAGRTSVLELLTQVQAGLGDSVVFDKVTVTSEAVLGTGRTLILSGLNQKERRSGQTGVPVLRSIPLLKYLFSTTTSLEVDTAVIILLTPRDPAFADARNRAALDAFVEKRRAFVAALAGSEEDFARFEERYPDWRDMPPNRFASHFFLMANSELYRGLSAHDLAEEDLDLDILGTQVHP